MEVREFKQIGFVFENQMLFMLSDFLAACNAVEFAQSKSLSAAYALAHRNMTSEALHHSIRGVSVPQIGPLAKSRWAREHISDLRIQVLELD